MTIDEAIQHCDEKASTVCGECAEQHRQLAAWLRELAAYRAADIWKIVCFMMARNAIRQQRSHCAGQHRQ